jgi:hypothetical protein
MAPDEAQGMPAAAGAVPSAEPAVAETVAATTKDETGVA